MKMANKYQEGESVADGVRYRRGRFQARVGSGKNRRSRVFDTRNEAIKWRDEVKQHPEIVASTDKGRMKIDDFVEEFWYKKLASKTEGHAKAGESHWRLHIKPILGGMRLYEINTGRVEQMVLNMQAKGYAKGTTEKTIAMVSGIFSLARRLEFISHNPCERVKADDTEAFVAHPITKDELIAIARVINPHFRVALYVLGYCGLRPTELWSMKVGRYNRKAKTLHVVEAGTYNSIDLRTGKAVKKSKPTKTGRDRHVPVPPMVAGLIESWIDEKGLSETELLFPSLRGKRQSQNNFHKRYFLPAARQAGIKGKMRTYDLRHTCATIYAQSGASMEHVRKILGHSTQEMSTRYAKLFSDDLQKAANLIEVKIDQGDAKVVQLHG